MPLLETPPSAQYRLFGAVCSIFMLVVSASVSTPPGTIVVVTAAQGGLMNETGPLNPHAYRPNEFVVQDMIYEGLVHYGDDGRIEPALAESWDDKSTSTTPSITFNLRKGVTFHDGTPWDANACKANFDQIFDPALRNYHGWYDLPKRIKSWEVLGSHTFRLNLDQPYYPALQELTLIRPARFISPRDLPQQADQKSCPSNAPLFWPTNVTLYSCVGVLGVSGTGPWVFEKKVTNQRSIGPKEVSTKAGQVNAAAGEQLQEVHFVRNGAHWNTKAGGNIQRVILKVLPTLNAVAAAMGDGSVQLVFGLDTLDPKWFRTLHGKDGDTVNTYISGSLSTRLVLLNSAKPPLNSLAVRKAIMHAIDKETVVSKELANLEPVAYQYFSRNIPYVSSVQLHPPLGYDPEKVRLMLAAANWTVGPDGVRRNGQGQPLELEFVYRTSSSTEVGIEDDIRASMEALGFKIKSTAVAHDEFNNRTVAGNFHMAFDTSLGLPWDPHSTANYWRTFKSYQFSFTNMANTSLTEGFTIKHPMSQAAFYEQIGKVLVTTDMGERQRLWTMILEAQHEQAVAAPLSYLVNVAVVSDRFENFVFGQQKYDMQLHKLVDKQLVGSRPGGAAALSTGAVAGIVVAVVVAVIAVGVIALLVVRERRGRPVFAPYVPMDEGLPNGQVGQAGTTANGKDVQMGHV